MATSNTRPSINSPGSSTRKHSERVDLNHLLNFSLPPRQPRNGVPGSDLPRRSRARHAGGGGGGSFYSGGNVKDKFVNSQFRFVMKPDENYAAHFADPDIYFPWSSILQIIVPTRSPLLLAQGSDPAYLPTSSTHASLSYSTNGNGNPNEPTMGWEELERIEMERERMENRRKREREEEEGLRCPICLDRPVAGRMTKCGHIFCYPCILHYFQLSDVANTAKCPICGDTIQEKLLKPVKWWDGESTTTIPTSLTGDAATTSTSSSLGERSPDGDSASQSSSHRLSMRLIQRPMITTLALPRSITWPSEALPINQAPFHFLPDVLGFSKFMLATENYMISEFQLNLRELENELKQGGFSTGTDELGKTFVQAAMRKVSSQMERLKEEMGSTGLKNQEKRSRDAWEDCLVRERIKREQLEKREKEGEERRLAKVDGEVVEFRAEDQAEEETQQGKKHQEDVPIEYLETIAQGGCVEKNMAIGNVPPISMPAINLATSPDKSTGYLGTTTTPTPKSKSRRNPNNNSSSTVRAFSNDDPSYFYYQSSSGANIYLHPLDIKILFSHYKSYNSFPDYINIRPEGSDEGTINEELRRRCKYLSHLPLGTDVVFVEADLEETIGMESLIPFEHALKMRRQRRREKVKKDDKAKAKWEAKEREKLPFGIRNGIAEVGYEISRGEELDQDFLLALERSTLDPGGFPPSLIAETSNFSNDSFPRSGVAGGSTANLSTSPVSNTSWGASSSSWASALHAPPGSRSIIPKRNPERDADIDDAWFAFEQQSAMMMATGGVKDTDKGEGEGKEVGKQGKKGKKNKVVLSIGGGGRRG